MSETITLTIIHEDNNGVSRETEVIHDLKMTLMSTLLKEKLVSGSFCGGRGTCRRCRVQFLQAAPIPTALERSAFSPDELRKGYRLACMAKPKNNCVIYLDFIESNKVDIITNVTDVSEMIDRTCQHKDFIKKSDFAAAVSNDNPLEEQTTYLIAVDLGTTTIAMQCVDLESGQVIDTYCALNPQRSYGADVLSRIQAASVGHAKELQDCVWNVIVEGVKSFYRRILKAGQEASSVCCMCIAGNTTMEHLLMGLPTESLGRSPFTPVEIGLQKCDLPIEPIEIETDVQKGAQPAEADLRKEAQHNLPVYILPGISAFVGGDIVAGLYHCGLLERKSGFVHTLPVKQTEQDGAVLFIDLGTNGEMAVLYEDRMIVTATAAGPAFEGGARSEVIGSDMVALTASLLEQGVLDETGLLKEPARLTQTDIRALQMAKAAVRVGVEILYEKIGRPKLKQVFLAGGFGYYLNVDAAVRIGLLPKAFQGCTIAAGNTSLAGAFEMGRDLLSGRLQESDLTGRLHRIESINLAKQENFEKMYLDNLNFSS